MKWPSFPKKRIKNTTKKFQRIWSWVEMFSIKQTMILGPKVN